MLILAVALIISAWPAWRLWRWTLVWRIYYSNSVQPVPAITAKHLTALRKLRFSWHALVESGGPVVDPRTPYGSANMADDLGPIVGTRDPVAIARFHRDVSAILIAVLRNDTLAPGRYRLVHLDNAWMERRLRRDLAHLPQERTEVVISELPRLLPDRHFTFTDRHRRLLRELRFEWPDASMVGLVARGGYPAPAVHFNDRLVTVRPLTTT